MSGHWTQSYIGLPWSRERDCVWLWEEVQEAVFGRSVRLPQTLSALNAGHNSDWLESSEGRGVFRKVPARKADDFLTVRNQRLICLRQAANGLATVDNARLEADAFGIYTATTTGPAEVPINLGNAGIWLRDLSQPAVEAELGRWQPAKDLPQPPV